MNIYTILMSNNTKYQTFFPKLIAKDNPKGTSNYSIDRISSKKNNNKSINNDQKYRLTYQNILKIPMYNSLIKDEQKQQEYSEIKQMRTTLIKKIPNPIIKINGYKIIRQIGKGGFAEVIQVCNQNQEKYAMKQYILQNSLECYKNQCIVGEYFFENGKIRNKFAQKRGGNNLISLVEKFKIGKKAYVVQQLGGKSLSKMISQIQGVFYKGQRVYEVKFSKFYEQLAIKKKFTKLILQIAQGIKLLNEEGFLHCDLKPENILIQQNEEETNCKIIDFGSSFIYNNGLPKITITPQYMPPELLDALNSQNSTSTLVKVDVWSIGCIMLEIMTGIPLWFRYKCKINIKGRENLYLGVFALTNRQYHKLIKKQRELCQNIKKLQFVHQQFQIYRKILSKILVFEENQRATIDQVIDMLEKII